VKSVDEGHEEDEEDDEDDDEHEEEHGEEHDEEHGEEHEEGNKVKAGSTSQEPCIHRAVADDMKAGTYSYEVVGEDTAAAAAATAAAHDECTK
jgi:hypothetical protein